MDESSRFKTIRILVIGIVLVGACVFFVRLFLENQQKSKASEAFADITMSSSLDTAVSSSPITVTSDQIIDISIVVNQTGGSGISGIDLSLDNPGLSFIPGGYSIDVNGVFTERILLDQQADGAGRNTLQRLVMIAKKTDSALPNGFVLKLRYKVVASNLTNSVPAVRVVFSPSSSQISGPNIPGNLYTIRPAADSIVNFVYNGAGISPTPGQCGNSVCDSNEECYYPPAPTCQVVNGQTTECATNVLPYCRPRITPTPAICGPNQSCPSGTHCYQPPIPVVDCIPNAPCPTIPIPTPWCAPDETPTGGPSPVPPTNGPTPTDIPIGDLEGAGLIFKVLAPDIAQTVATLSQVRLQIKDGNNTPVDTIISLQRVSGTNYFKTTTTLDLDLQGTKLYTVYVKGQKTLRRSFTEVRLTHGSIIDCSGSVISSDCGGLSTINSKQLWSGDSDGFNDGTNGTTNSDSYNKVDAVDLQRLIVGYGSAVGAEPNGDYNLDGQINVLDLGILGRNLYKSGE